MHIYTCCSFPAVAILLHIYKYIACINIYQFICSVVFATPQTAACQASLPSPTPRAYSHSCPLSWWCHPTISSSVIPFSSRLQSFPASGSFPVSQFGWLSIIPWGCALWLHLCVRYTETNVSKSFFVSVLFISFCWFVRVCVYVCVFSALAECST